MQSTGKFSLVSLKQCCITSMQHVFMVNSYLYRCTPNDFNLIDAYQTTLPIAVKWKELGLALGIEQTTLDSIEAAMTNRSWFPEEEQMKKALWRVLNLWFVNILNQSQPGLTW